MSTEELHKHGADLARKYERHLNTFEFCQELADFKEQAPLLFGGCGDIIKPSAFYLLQQIYTRDLLDAFPNICIALRIYCTLPPHPEAVSEVLVNLNLLTTICDIDEPGTFIKSRDSGNRKSNRTSN